MEILSYVKNLSLLKKEVMNVILKEYEEKVKQQELLVTKYEKVDLA